MKIEYYEEMLEQEAINKYLNMIANDYNGELAKIFQEKYINKDKEIEKLHNIIKEVREWANKTIFYFDFEEEITKHAFDLLYTKQGQELLEILEKENK